MICLRDLDFRPDFELATTFAVALAFLFVFASELPLTLASSESVMMAMLSAMRSGTFASESLWSCDIGCVQIKRPTQGLLMEKNSCRLLGCCSTGAKRLFAVLVPIATSLNVVAPNLKKGLQSNETVKVKCQKTTKEKMQSKRKQCSCNANVSGTEVPVG